MFQRTGSPTGAAGSTWFPFRCAELLCFNVLPLEDGYNIIGLFPFRCAELLCFNQVRTVVQDRIYMFPFRCAELLCFNIKSCQRVFSGIYVSIPLRGIAVFQRPH